MIFSPKNRTLWGTYIRQLRPQEDGNILQGPQTLHSQEIGIRLALGAGSSDVKNMVVFQGMRLALVGAAIGLVAAFAMTRFLESFLFQVKGHDPLVFIAVPVVLSLIALFAVWFPALRASRIAPIEALRYE